MRKWLQDKLRAVIYDPRDKYKCQEQHIEYMLARTQQMFKYDGLPDTIPARILELYLQTNGHLCFYRHEGELYIYTGALGGEPNVYYMPTIYTISNPAQNLSKNLTIDKDCIVVSNDSLYIGLLPLYHKYAYHMAENELSMLVTDINLRIISLISASDDRTIESARKMLAEIESGKIGIISDSAFLEGVKVQSYSGNSGKGVLTDLIEYEQYLKASWYNEIGLDSNYNMKRETITATESQMNSDALLPLIDDMLHCRELGLEKVNAMFGTDIRVSLASAWEDNQEQTDIMTEMLEAKVTGAENPPDVSEGDIEKPEPEEG